MENSQSQAKEMTWEGENEGNAPTEYCYHDHQPKCNKLWLVGKDADHCFPYTGKEDNNRAGCLPLNTMIDVAIFVLSWLAAFSLEDTIRLPPPSIISVFQVTAYSLSSILFFFF